MVCFLGMGCRGTVSLAPATLPWKNRWVSLCASLQSRQGDGEHEKVKGDEARINVPKTGPKFEKTERMPRRGGLPGACPRTNNLRYIESKPFVNSMRKFRKYRAAEGDQSGPVCPARLMR